MTESITPFPASSSTIASITLSLSSRGQPRSAPYLGPPVTPLTLSQWRKSFLSTWSGAICSSAETSAHTAARQPHFSTVSRQPRLFMLIADLENHNALFSDGLCLECKMQQMDENQENVTSPAATFWLR